MATLQEIFDAAQALPSAERAQLIHALWKTVSQDDWIAEAQQRSEVYDAGRMTASPWSSGHEKWELPLHRVTLKCKVGEDADWHAEVQAHLALEFCSVEQDSVRTRISLEVGDHTFRDQRGIFGYDLARFVKDLERLHATLDGTVRLDDFDQDPILCFYSH